ncbi:hypothetical protein ACIRU3_31415 [Streptomyces sp. NPDC101151]|uniref:hypothetical protein n=1 Tax=Streptomyces sp. NPDC101151 TaxID=3366115 RepID=UPI0037F74AAA
MAVEEPQAPVQGLAQQEAAEPVPAAPARVLVPYRDAADVLGVVEETVRGAASKSPRLTKYPAPDNPRAVRIDLNEARRAINVKRTTGA